ncbi:MAG: LEA type 2 family protein [Phycisphaerae bacterium]
MTAPDTSLWFTRTVTMLLLLACGGCGMVESPSARVTGIALDDIDMESLTLRFAVDVTNPYPAPLPLTNLDYSLASDGNPFLDGNAALQGSVPAGSTKTVFLPARVTYRRLLSAVSGIRPGELMPYEATMGLSVDAPVLGNMRLPLRRSGKVPVPAAPGVKIADVTWQELSLSRAAGVIALDLTNRNRFPVDLSALQYALSVGGTQVADSRVNKPVSFAAGETARVEIPVAFSTTKLGLGALQMLRGESTYGLDGTAEFGTSYGPMNLPLSWSGKVEP